MGVTLPLVLVMVLVMVFQCSLYEPNGCDWTGASSGSWWSWFQCSLYEPNGCDAVGWGAHRTHLIVSVFFIRTEWVWLTIREWVTSSRASFSVLYTNRMGVTRQRMSNGGLWVLFQCSLYEPNGCDIQQSWPVGLVWCFSVLYTNRMSVTDGNACAWSIKFGFSVLYTNRMSVTWIRGVMAMAKGVSVFFIRTEWVWQVWFAVWDTRAEEFQCSLYEPNECDKAKNQKQNSIFIVSVFFIRTEWVWLRRAQTVNGNRKGFSVLYTNRMSVTTQNSCGLTPHHQFQCSLYEPNGCDPRWLVRWGWTLKFQCSLYEPNGCDRVPSTLNQRRMNSFSVLYTNRMGVTQRPNPHTQCKMVSVFFIRTEWVWPPRRLLMLCR